MEVVVFEKYAIGALDHASALTQMRAARPDWIIATGYVNDLILIRKQMADISLRAPLITMINGPAYKEFIDAVGPLSENVTSAAWWHPSAKYTGNDVFKSAENYTKLFIAKYRLGPGLHHRGRLADRGRSADGDREGRDDRSRQGAGGAGEFEIRDLLWTDRLQQRGTGNVLYAADLPDPRPEIIRRPSAGNCIGRTAAEITGQERADAVPQILANGLLLGGLYACIAVGFSLVWGVTNIINMLHGSFIVVGAYAAFFAYQTLGINPFVTLPVIAAPDVRDRLPAATHRDQTG